ncbi:MAG: DUF1501 domain-containing protein [Verrucomicrobia bacterium]|nr:DUF1501 domain-containing protein [Verrucomicrobiota bacterium]MDA1068702.1 DUF1501 domain-containing protein [Verrucomicrobiota bacterium]
MFLGGSSSLAATSFPKGKADHCIMLWLGGGCAHIDTWDPKRKGNAVTREPGTYYDVIPTAVDGIQVCEHLPRSAQIMDRISIIRTVNHNTIDEHAAAVNRMHTGRSTSGTVIYPSIGSIIAHERGPGDEGVPPYVLIGYPNLTRGPGFLGARDSYLYLTDTEAGPGGLIPPPDVDATRTQQRQTLLNGLRKNYIARGNQDEVVKNYDIGVETSLKLSGSSFMDTFNLNREKPELRESYGGEFGQRCLLARRLVQSGVRFVEVSHNLNFINGTGWDTHKEGQLQQHGLIRELDHAFASLTLDLEAHNLLDRTLVIIGTEFGRPPEFDAWGGRGHHSKAFSIVMAGGGLNHGRAVGETDELGREIVHTPVSVADLFATIFSTLKIDPSKELFDGDRPVPISDGGVPVAQLFG